MINDLETLGSWLLTGVASLPLWYLYIALPATCGVASLIEKWHEERTQR